MTSSQHNNNDPQQTFNEAVNKGLDQSRISVCLASTKNSMAQPDFQRLEITTTLADRFRNIIRRFCELQQEDQKVTREYSIDQKPGVESVQFVSLTEFPEVQARVSKLGQPANIPPFVQEDMFVRGLKFYAIVAQLENGNRLIGLRSITPAQKPGNSKWSVKAIYNHVNRRYDLLDYDPFLFDEEIDCLLYGNFVFIANRSKFEQVFKFDQVTRDVAQRAMSRLQPLGIANFDEFREVCLRDRRKQRMLAPIANNPDISHVTVSTAREVVRTNPKLASIIGVENGHEVLAFEPSEPWNLLRFLKQTTVRTVASGNPFEVDGDMNPL